MKVFLDENFPLTLVYRLRDDGHDAEHVITLGWRGASDAQIAEGLVDRNVVFLTQDEDFLFTRELAAIVVLSGSNRRDRYVSGSTSGAAPFSV